MRVFTDKRFPLSTRSGVNNPIRLRSAQYFYMLPACFLDGLPMPVSMQKRLVFGCECFEKDPPQKSLKRFSGALCYSCTRGSSSRRVYLGRAFYAETHPLIKLLSAPSSDGPVHAMKDDEIHKIGCRRYAPVVESQTSSKPIK